MNILIGPNGSGKTTILNLLHSILSADLPSLLNVNFGQAEIKLREFEGRSVRTVKVGIADGFLKLSAGRNKFEIDIDFILRRRSRQLALFHESSRRMLPEKLYDLLTALVPIVWLPISRRLPVTEDEEELYTMAGSLESVDLRLRELLEDLSRYHTRLNALLSERYRKFEHQVLSVILYSKENDQLDSILNSIRSSPLTDSSPLTEVEKGQLLGGF